jgi:Abnormal spindle-like microcephaly-assoc'd, ASPM-SPD-2-Hydin/PQQ-like domain
VRKTGIVVVLGVLLLSMSVGVGQALGVEITNSGDSLRTGWYPDEPSITPQLLHGGTFGQLWSTPVEGQVYAQPLLADGAVLVATEANKVYSLDPATGASNWAKPVDLGVPWDPSEIACGDLTPQSGVTATPVVDPSTNTAYLTHKTYVSGTSGPSEWFMDAIDLANGSERPGFPVLLEGTAQNVADEEPQSFTAQTELQRPGLLLMNGVVYAAFGSECDTAPWQGWVFGVSTSGTVKARWVADELGNGAGIWQSGAGLTSDEPGTILLSTGNGWAPTQPAPGDEPPIDLGESVVRLRVQPDGSLKATDFFAPFDAASLDGWDADFASGGVTGLPNEYFGTAAIPHLAVAVGKDGYVYLLNRDHLGGIGQGPSGSDDVVQRLGPYGGVWSRPGVWPGEGGWVYIPTASGGESAGGSAGNLYMYKYGLSGSGTPALSLQGVSEEEFGFGSSAPVITSEGTTPGSALVWVVWSPNGTGVGAQLRAYAPTPNPDTHEPELLWSAPVGTSAKFTTPGVGAGRLYVGTRDGHVLGFGSPVTPLLSGPATAFPTTTVGSSSERTLTLTANTALTLSSLKSSSSQFQLGTPSSSLPAQLAAGETIQIPITFSPTSTGPLAATLTANTSEGDAATFSLSGAGQAASGKLEASPPLVTFGGTSVGAQLDGSATFRNVGATALTIDTVQVPGAPFGVEGAPQVGSTIAPGESVTVDLTFSPDAIGTFEGKIELDTSGGDEAVGLSGSAGGPGELSIASETNDYGSVSTGSSATKMFTVANVGGTSVEITKSKPPVGGEFAATSMLAEGSTIKPGASVTETVVFTPTVVGEASGFWAITGNDTTGPQQVDFRGVGIKASSTIKASGTTEVAPALALVSQLPGNVGILSSIESTPPSPSPDAELASRALIASSSGVVDVGVRCPTGVEGCAGTVTLRTLAAVLASASGRSAPVKAAILTLAKGSFAALAGQTRIVRLHLLARARALLARVHRLRALATILARDPQGAAHTARTTVTIRTAKG